MRAFAAALLAVTFATVLTGCGDDDGGAASPSPTAAASPIGSPTETDGSPAETGEAPGALDLTNASFVFTGDGAGDLLTGSHSLAFGDFNDDGEADLLIGAPQHDGPDARRTDGGAAYIVFGPLQGEKSAAEADVTVFGAFAGDSLGYAVTAGDLNGDDVDDALVGAPGVTAGFDARTDQGRVYVFYGGADFGEEPVRDLAADVFDFTVTGAEGFSRAGNALAMGDINDDGTNDLVVGAPFAGRAPGSAPGSERTTVGEVYVIYGGDLSGEKNIARDEFDVLISGKEAQGQFGAALAVGDFDGDGPDDIAIGAHRSSADGTRLQSGAVYVFLGDGDLPQRLSIQDADEDAQILGPAASASFGFPLAAGDFDADGMADLAAGAQVEAPAGVLSAGAVRIFFGGDLRGTIDLQNDEAAVTMTGLDAGQLLPSALAAASGDEGSAADLVIGSLLTNTNSKLSPGAAYVVTAAAGLDGTLTVSEAAGASVVGTEADDRLGNAVAAALIDDTKAIALLAPGTAGGEGSVYVILLR